jgi:trigger factor
MAEDAGATRLRYLVEQSLSRVDSAPELPPVEAPSLEGLEVTVPAEKVTVEELEERFAELRRQHAEVRPRDLGEPIALGDEVLVDVVGHCNERMIPFSARVDAWLEMAPEPSLPGFFEALAGVPVGSCVDVELTVPDDHPIPEFRGAPALFRVDIKAAREVRLPEPENPEFLAALGMGANLDEVMETLALEVANELEGRLRIKAENLVLDAVAARTNVQVPPALVDEEIHRRWLFAEGSGLQERGLSKEELDEAFAGWKAHPEIRAEVEWRLRIGLALGAIVKRDGLQPTPEFAAEVVDEVAATSEVTREEILDLVKSDKQVAAKLAALAQHQYAVQYVFEKAKVRYEDG